MPLTTNKDGKDAKQRQSWAELLLPFLLNCDCWILFVYFLLSGARPGLLIAGSLVVSLAWL